MILKEIFEEAQWPEVAIAIVSSYPNQRKSIRGYEEVFDLLKKKTPVASDCQLVIEYLEDDFDPGHYYYHLSGRKDGDEKNLSLLFCPWAEWMGMEVSEATLSALSYAQIVAHSLFEITFTGFSEACMESEKKRLDDIVEDSKVHPEKLIELKPEDLHVEISMKDWIKDTGRWLRWGAFSKEYYGESAKWFREHFTGDEAPKSFSELERQTLKAALKEVARIIENASANL